MASTPSVPIPRQNLNTDELEALLSKLDASEKELIERCIKTVKDKVSHLNSRI